MRPSPQRHTLAVLRTFLGLTQKEMADIAECSRPTIQAVELGKLKLSFDLAQRIHFKTGVLLEWLLTNKVDCPLLADDMEPYSREVFEERQAALFAPSRTGTDACVELWDVWSLFARHVELLSLLYAEAYKKGKVGIVAYKSAMATAELVRTTLKLSEPIAEKFKTGAAKEVAPERLDEVTRTLQEFAATTYEELKRKLKQSKQPLSTQARVFVRDYDKKLARIAKK
jgi:transcriptional regulator with XRE-family HTH domain